MIVTRENCHQPFRVDESLHERGVFAVVLAVTAGCIAAICLVSNRFGIDAWGVAIVFVA
jgi:hypothetical protein